MARQQAGESKAPVVIALAFFVLATLILGVLTYLAYSDMAALRADMDKAGKEKKAAQDIAEVEKGKVLLYKSALGVNTPEETTNLQNLRPDPEKAVKEELATLRSNVDGRVASAVAAEAKNFAGGGRFVPPADVFSWNWPDGGKMDPAPKRAMIDQLVGIYASQQLAIREAEAAKQQAANEQAAAKTAQDAATKAKADYEARAGQIPGQVAAQVKKFQDDVEKARTTLGGDTAKFNDDRKAWEADKQKLELAIRKLQEEIERKNRLVATLDERLAVQTDPFEYDKPHGKIVAKNGDVVTIDLGSAANVRPRLTFTIQPADTPIRGMQARMKPDGKGGMRVVPKAQIEVIEVLGPNASRARITSNPDKIREGVLVGDLLYNAAWRPGAPDHVALFGIFDVDGDGTDDIRRLARDLSAMGVTVDAYYDLTQNKWVGELTEKTIFAVEGNLPFKSGTTGQSDAVLAAKARVRDGIEAARKEAVERGAKVVKMRDFFPRVGYAVNLDVPESRLDQAASKYLVNAPAPAKADQ